MKTDLGFNIKFVSVVLILVIIEFIVIYAFFQPPEYNCSPYENGEIEVIFSENVTEEEATEIVEAYNCTILNGDYWRYSEDGHTVYSVENNVSNTVVRYKAIVKVPYGEETQYVEKFKEIPKVYDASILKTTC
jgi:hypothetical protein